MAYSNRVAFAAAKASPSWRAISKLYMVGIAQLVRASDCGSEGRGFESHYSPHLLHNALRKQRVMFTKPTLGRSQVVRQRTLTPPLAGSSPAVPAIFSWLTRKAALDDMPAACRNRRGVCRSKSESSRPSHFPFGAAPTPIFMCSKYFFEITKKYSDKPLSICYNIKGSVSVQHAASQGVTVSVH